MNNKQKFIRNYYELHQIPEINFSVHKTINYLKQEIAKLDVEIISYPNNILAVKLTKNRSRGYILYRAETDALPIIEETNLSYKSKNNAMHACGHDFHMAIALGLLREFSVKDKNINLLVVFQPAEEIGAGAYEVIKHLKNESIVIENCLTCHCHPELESRKIGIKSGIFLATNVAFNFEVKQQYKHSAVTNNKNIHLAQKFSKMISIIEQFELPNELINIGVLKIGSLREQIPNTGYMQGTFRTFDKARKNQFKELLERIAEQYNLKLTYEVSCPIVENDQNLVALIRQKDDFELIELPQYLHCDDFGYYKQIAPSVYLTYGIKQYTYAPIHSPEFNIDIEYNYEAIHKIAKIIEIIWNNGKNA